MPMEKKMPPRRYSLIRPMLLALITGLTMTAAPSLADTLPMQAHYWQEIQLNKGIKPNTFHFKQDQDKAILQIESNASMSMMATAIQVDLAKTPFLCWRWRINRILDKADMTERSGDDYAARLYLSVAIPTAEQSLGLRMQLGLARSIWGNQVPDGAINYVWDNRYPKGTTQANAYTDRVIMIVTQSGADHVGQWVPQVRNVAEDIKKFFTPSAQPIQIALAADTDNTGETAIAEFKDIQFVGDAARCH